VSSARYSSRLGACIPLAHLTNQGKSPRHQNDTVLVGTMPRSRKPSTARQRPADTFAFTVRLSADLANALADIATAEGRSRSKQIERAALRVFVQSYRRDAAA
jgi:hypothetical protein